jgi:iron complex transport system substrate-binding protein
MTLPFILHITRNSRLFGRVAFAICLSMLTLSLRAAPLQVTDGLGRVVTFKESAKTVAYLSFYEAIPALKVWDKTVGLSRFAFDNALMRASNPHIEVISNIGSASDINAEKLMKLHPDVVITRGDHPALVEFMTQKGLSVLALNPHTIDDVWRDLRLQAAVIGTPQAADPAISESRKLLDEISVKIQGVTKPKTVLWLWSKPTKVVGSEGVTADIIRLLKVNNPGNQYGVSTPDIGMENIIKFNPDVILICGTAKYSEADILDNPQWRSINAVRNKRVYKAPNWGVWSPHAASMALWAATRVYPEHFDPQRSQIRIAAFHKTVFGVDVPE